jgi:formylmethanofuran dehydrogenase subunit E
MSTILNKKWNKIDKNEEESFINNIKFIRPINDNPISLDCNNCKELISTVDDVESAKDKSICKLCYDLYYYPNKEKWDKGWRPNKY